MNNGTGIAEFNRSTIFMWNNDRVEKMFSEWKMKGGEEGLGRK